MINPAPIYFRAFLTFFIILSWNAEAGANLHEPLSEKKENSPEDAESSEETINILVDSFINSFARKHIGSQPGIIALSLKDLHREDENISSASLINLISGLLSDRLQGIEGITGIIHVESGEEGFMEAMKKGASTYLDAGLKVSDSLLLAGSMRPSWVNFWDGEICCGESSIIHAEAELDRTTRILLGLRERASPETLNLYPLAEMNEKAIAISAGDLSGNGKSELAVLLERELVILEYGKDNRAHEITRYSFHSRPRSLVQSRDITGGIAVTRIGQTPAVLYNHSGLASGEVLAWSKENKLRRLSTINEYPVSSYRGNIVYGKLVPGTNFYSESVRVSGPDAAEYRLADHFITAAADPVGGFLLAVDRQYRLVSYSRAGEKQIHDHIGSAMALADFSGQNNILRIGSSPNPPSDEDRLLVTDSDGNIRDLKPVPGTIISIATGNISGRENEDIFVLSRMNDISRILLLAGDFL